MLSKTLASVIQRVLRRKEHNPERQQDFLTYFQLLTQAGVHSEEDINAILRDRSQSDEIRSVACWVLAEIGHRPSYSTFLQVLQDTQENAPLRSEVATFLGVLNSRRAIGPLIKLLRQNSDARTRELAARALSDLSDTRIVEPLMASASDLDEQLPVRAQSIESLGRLLDIHALPTLW